MLFILISCCFQKFFTIPVDTENPRQKLSLSIPTGAQITAENDTMDMPPLVADKTNKYLSK